MPVKLRSGQLGGAGRFAGAHEESLRGWRWVIQTGIFPLLPTSACTGWTGREMRRHGMLVRYAGDLVVMCNPDSRLRTRLRGLGVPGRPRVKAEGRHDPDHAPADGWGRLVHRGSVARAPR
jgi:hypothetical protein